MPQINLVELKSNELEQAAKVISEAFREDELINWFFKSKIEYEKYSQSMFKIWLSYCLQFGKLYRTEDFGAVIALRAPDNHHISLWKAIQTGLIWNLWQLGKDGFARLEAFTQSAEKVINEQDGIENYWYVWLLGALPEKQGQGYGSALLKQLLVLQQLDNASAVLETSSTRAKSLYEKNGFFCAKSIKPAPESPETFCMIRPAPGGA